jgi:C-terminal peptidase prc
MLTTYILFPLLLVPAPSTGQNLEPVPSTPLNTGPRGPAALALANPVANRAALTSPAQDNFEVLLQSRMDQAEASPDSLISLRDGRSVAHLLGDEDGVAFDAACDALLRRGKAGPQGTLFLVAARLAGDDPDMELLASALTPLVESADAELVGITADVLASSGFDAAQSDTRRKITELLLGVAEDGIRPPDARVACAVAAHEIALGESVHRPRRILNQFLNSTEADLRAQGALGMARLGILREVKGVESELEALSTEAGPRGRLAQAYLKQLAILRHKDTELRRARERQAELQIENTGGSLADDLSRVGRLIDFVQGNHLDGGSVTREDLLLAAMQGILQAMDAHSSYFPPEAFERFQQDMQAEYGGIGAYVGIDPDDGLFTITRPIYSGPAYKAGLTTDDKIIRVGEWPTVGEETTEVIKRLKGRPGTDVKLYIWSRGMDPTLIDRPTEDMSVNVTRAAITIPPVNSSLLPGNVGLIELTTFSRVASREVFEALNELKERGATSWILDLRNNTGGYLAEAVNVSDLFLPVGKRVVSTETTQGEGRRWDTRFDPVVPESDPVVVLINRFSASASEIVSGALQDHGRAQLVGQRSFGKGSVQDLFMLPGDRDDGFADENNNNRRDDWESLTRDTNENGEFDYAPRVKLTIERYLLPTGRSIHRELDDEGNISSPGGIAPDIEVQANRIDGWRLSEMRTLQGTRKLREWVQDNYVAQSATFEKLALNDGRDWKSWPGFENLYASLSTPLSREDVRLLLRVEVRRAVQDAAGKAFPQGDFEEDLQLQRAIKTLLGGDAEGWQTIREFAATFRPVDDDADKNTPPLVAHAEDLRTALSRLAAVESGEAELTDDDVAELHALLQSLSGEKF